jgi:hypothetical protein
MTRKNPLTLVPLLLAISVVAFAQKNQFGPSTLLEAHVPPMHLTPEVGRLEKVMGRKLIHDFGDVYVPFVFPNGRQKFPGGLFQNHSEIYDPRIKGQPLFDVIDGLYEKFSFKNNSQPMLVADFCGEGMYKATTYGGIILAFDAAIKPRPIEVGAMVSVDMVVDNSNVASGPFQTGLQVLVKGQAEPAAMMELRGFLFNGIGVLAPGTNKKEGLWEGAFVKSLALKRGANRVTLCVDARVPALLQPFTRLRVQCSNPGLRLKLEQVTLAKKFKVDGNTLTFLGPQQWLPQNIFLKGTLMAFQQKPKGAPLGELTVQTDKPAVINLMNQTRIPLVAG